MHQPTELERHKTQARLRNRSELGFPLHSMELEPPKIQTCSQSRLKGPRCLLPMMGQGRKTREPSPTLHLTGLRTPESR